MEHALRQQQHRPHCKSSLRRLNQPVAPTNDDVDDAVAVAVAVDDRVSGVLLGVCVRVLDCEIDIVDVAVPVPVDVFVALCVAEYDWLAVMVLVMDLVGITAGDTAPGELDALGLLYACGNEHLKLTPIVLASRQFCGHKSCTCSSAPYEQLVRCPTPNVGQADCSVSVMSLLMQSSWNVPNSRLPISQM